MKLLSMCKFLLGCAMGYGGLLGVGCGRKGLGRLALVLFMGLVGCVIILVGLCSLLFIHCFYYNSNSKNAKFINQLPLNHTNLLAAVHQLQLSRYLTISKTHSDLHLILIANENK